MNRREFLMAAAAFALMPKPSTFEPAHGPNKTVWETPNWAGWYFNLDAAHIASTTPSINGGFTYISTEITDIHIWDYAMTAEQFREWRNIMDNGGKCNCNICCRKAANEA